ncbi:hypothetical protein [Enterococcus faecalis]|uniref:hypothetical protein n=1 Tax=Enterococcus faecalis TaxID=1351 RepID=UPI00076FA402|nr:hypothetical protein [Enterococcus faecalis]
MPTSFRLISDFFENPLLFIFLLIFVVLEFIIYDLLEQQLVKWLSKNPKKDRRKLARLFRVMVILCFISAFIFPTLLPVPGLSQVPMGTFVFFGGCFYFHYFRKKVIELQKKNVSKKDRKKRKKKPHGNLF